MNNINVSEQMFDWKFYVTKNSLEGKYNNQPNAWNHWITIGKNGGYWYKIFNHTTFDWNFYLSVNKDLFRTGITTKEISWKHWTREGYKNRQYRIIESTLGISKPQFINKKPVIDNNIVVNNIVVDNNVNNVAQENIKDENKITKQIVDSPKIETKTFNYKIFINDNKEVVLDIDFQEYNLKSMYNFNNKLIVALGCLGGNIIELFECEIKNQNVLLTKIKEYNVYNLRYLLLDIDDLNDIILYVGDRYNIKLFKYDTKLDLWDQNYFILKKCNDTLQSIKKDNNVIIVQLESSDIIKFNAVYDMYKLDVIDE